MKQGLLDGPAALPLAVADHDWYWLAGWTKVGCTGRKYDLWTPLVVDLGFDRILKVVLYANSSIRVRLLHADGTFMTGDIEV